MRFALNICPECGEEMSAHTSDYCETKSKARKSPAQKIVNLTPHDITLTRDGVDTIFPKSGQVVRCESCQIPDAPIGGTIPLVVNTFGNVIGLPNPAPGVVYLVSNVVAAHPSIAGKRLDVVAPNTGPTAIRNAEGQTIAVRSFQRF